MSHLGNAICTCIALWFWNTMEGSQSVYSLCSREIYQGSLPSLNPSCPDPFLWKHTDHSICAGASGAYLAVRVGLMSLYDFWTNDFSFQWESESWFFNQITLWDSWFIFKCLPMFSLHLDSKNPLKCAHDALAGRKLHLLGPETYPQSSVLERSPWQPCPAFGQCGRWGRGWLRHCRTTLSMVKTRNMALCNVSGRPLVRKGLVKQSQSHGSGSQDAENEAMGVHTIYMLGVRVWARSMCLYGEWRFPVDILPPHSGHGSYGDVRASAWPEWWFWWLGYAWDYKNTQYFHPRYSNC